MTSGNRLGAKFLPSPFPCSPSINNRLSHAKTLLFWENTHEDSHSLVRFSLLNQDYLFMTLWMLRIIILIHQHWQPHTSYMWKNSCASEYDSGTWISLAWWHTSCPIKFKSLNYSRRSKHLCLSTYFYMSLSFVCLTMSPVACDLPKSESQILFIFVTPSSK